MSATGRGTNRDPKDFYPTDRKAFASLIPFLPVHQFFYEPCAGDGRLIGMLRDSGRVCDGADLFPQESGGLYPLTPVDYLKDETQRDFVVTNPPFSVAFEMCRHAKLHSREFMFLLRLSFLESETRAEWLSANEPGALFVLKKRPSFVLSVTCKSVVLPSNPAYNGCNAICKTNTLLPIESPRPTVCPVCGGSNLSISTSDNSGYAWFYWGDRFLGIHHI